MLKARGEAGGKPLLVLGLTRENLDRLSANQPIVIIPEQMTELQLPEMTIVILGGETMQDLNEDLKALGWA